MARKFSGRLPDGKVINNVRLYVSTWRRLGEDVIAALGIDLHVVGYEPGILFGRKGGGRSVDIPADVCLAIQRLRRQRDERPKA